MKQVSTVDAGPPIVFSHNTWTKEIDIRICGGETITVTNSTKLELKFDMSDGATESILSSDTQTWFTFANAGPEDSCGIKTLGLYADNAAVGEFGKDYT